MAILHICAGSDDTFPRMYLGWSICVCALVFLCTLKKAGPWSIPVLHHALMHGLVKDLLLLSLEERI